MIKIPASAIVRPSTTPRRYDAFCSATRRVFSCQGMGTTRLEHRRHLAHDRREGGDDIGGSVLRSDRSRCSLLQLFLQLRHVSENVSKATIEAVQAESEALGSFAH